MPRMRQTSLDHRMVFAFMSSSQSPTCAIACAFARLASLSRMAFSALRFSITSRNTNATPMAFPFASLMGEALLSTGTSWPVQQTRMVRSLKEKGQLRWSALSTWPVTGTRVSSSRMFRTSDISRFIASADFQPVMASAAGFMKVIRASIPVVMTASPMLFSVVSIQLTRLVQLDIERVLVEGHLDGRPQFPLVERLKNVAERLGHLGPLESGKIRVSGKIDDRNVELAAYVVGRLDAVHFAFQADVHEDDVGVRLLGLLDGVLSVRRTANDDIA